MPQRLGRKLLSVHGLKVTSHILGSNGFRAEERLSTDWEFRAEKNGPLWALYRVIPSSKMVTEVLLATPLKVTRDSRSKPDQWQPWNGRTSRGRGLWDT